MRAAGLLTVFLATLAHAQPLPRSDERAETLTVYLRADGRLGTHGHAAIELTIAALARLPGIGARFYVDPDDRGAPALAEALASLPDDHARCALLLVLHERNPPGFTDPQVLESALRAIGRAPKTNAGDTPRRRFFIAPVPSAAARAIMCRPDGVDTAQSAFVALGKSVLTADSLWQLAHATAMPARSPTSPIRGRATHLATQLSMHEVSVRFPSGPTAEWKLRACALLEAARPLHEAHRIELRVHIDQADDAKGPALLRQALRVADATTRLALARRLCDMRWPATVEDAAALLRELGLDVDAVGQVATRRQTTDEETLMDSAELTVDGHVAAPAELARLWDLPTLRTRVSGRSLR